ncbi:MAG: hypothetical protein HKM89_14550 [Gemmatimonadales bacterium]|nr:hypothetical protein [Gemmatimonadales bacterium]
MCTNRIALKTLCISRRVAAAVVLGLFLLQTTGCTHIGQAKPADVARRPVPILGVVTKEGAKYMFDSPGWMVRDTVFGPMNAQEQLGRPDSTHVFPAETLHRVLVREQGMSSGTGAFIAGVSVLLLVGGWAIACSGDKGGFVC